MRLEEDGKEHLGMKLVSGHYVKERKEKVSRRGKQTRGEADLFKVSWVKSPLGHKKRNSPIGQSQLAAFTADACIGETVRFKAWWERLHLLFSIHIDSQRLVFLLITEMSQILGSFGTAPVGRRFDEKESRRL